MNTKAPFISTFDLYDHSKSFGLVIVFVSRSWLGVRLAVLKKFTKLDCLFGIFLVPSLLPRAGSYKSQDEVT